MSRHEENAMARKQARTENTAEALGQSVVESAQAIWLAGLGAYSRARTEGDALFEKLVEQGKGLRERVRDAADEAMKTARGQADEKITQAQGQWDRLEQVFEERVQRSLNRLGVMTRAEIDDLSRQVQELNASVQALMKATGAPAAKSKRRATAKGKPRARKSAAKAKR
jgi:poly(hydroxyalkanoate) granule-associated protein